MKWIDVTKELPKEDGFYNVEIKTKDDYITHSCWFYRGEWCYDNYFTAGELLDRNFFNVLSWKPMPKLKKVGSKIKDDEDESELELRCW